MKQRKRSMQILVVLVLMFSLVVSACSNNGGNNNPEPTKDSGSGSPTNEASATPAADKLDPYEVVITYFGTPEKDVAEVQDKLSEYFKEKINATVKLVPYASADFKTKTELSMSTGEKMDLIFTASWLGYFENIVKKAYLPLDELLDEYGQGIKENLNPLYLEAPRFKGELYAIPTNKEITQGKAFMYRQDIVKDYNIPIDDINSYDDLKPYLEMMHEKNPDMVNLYVSGQGKGDGIMYETRSNYRPIGPLINKSAGWFYDYTDTDNVVVKDLLDPEITEVNKKEFEVMHTMFEEGLINSDAATNTDKIDPLRLDGKTWVQAVTWKPGADAEMETSVQGKYKFVSHILEEPVVTTDLATGSMMAISRTSKDPARAMMVLNLLHTDPYPINLIVNGIEGKHYTKTGPNRIEHIQDSGYGESALFWVIGNQLNNYLLPAQPDDLYENWKTFNNEAKRSPLLGFVFDATNVQNEVSALNNIMNEYAGIRTGAVANTSKLVDERNAKLKAAGIETVTKEIQKQITEWQANQK
ncbi:ABC transporter substrate-binding protein [Paenibacillus sp. HB172176]|uniref:ABC transporter substrate-binding protein n=1 Tax=Paenibacillus sp. HB172176 TaxID=2493690 RepID=UPI00143C9A13|nr:ABC transporter substrate-binding protein [Paenibacillus sp. HB172176]